MLSRNKKNIVIFVYRKLKLELPFANNKIGTCHPKTENKVVIGAWALDGTNAVFHNHTVALLLFAPF